MYCCLASLGMLLRMFPGATVGKALLLAGSHLHGAPRRYTAVQCISHVYNPSAELPRGV